VKNTQNKINDIEAKIKSLQEKKSRALLKLKDERFKLLEQLGLFDLDDAALCGLVQSGLKDKERHLDTWQYLGQQYLEGKNV